MKRQAQPPSSDLVGGDGRRRSWPELLLPPFLIAALVVLYLAPAAFASRIFFLRDALQWFYPSRLYLRGRLLAGDFPLWAPELDTGAPFLADPGQGVFYPLNVLLLLSSPACVSQFLVIHFLLAALGTFLLLRQLEVHPAAASLGAFGYGLGGYLLSMTWSGVYLLSVAWMPLIAFLALRLGRSARLRDCALLGLALGCQILSGEMQGVMFTALLVVPLVLAEVHRWPERLRAMALLACSCILAIGLALPQLLPTLDLLSVSTRAEGIGLDEASSWSMHPLRLLELLAPGVFGDASNADGRYLGHFLNDEAGLQHKIPWMSSPYLGSLSLALAAVGLLLPAPRHRRWTLAAAAVGVVATALAFGRHTPVFGVFFRSVPFVNVFRYPEKYFAIVALVLPLMAAAGLDSCLTADKGRLRRVALFAALAAGLLAALLLAAAFAGPAAGALAALTPEVAINDALRIVRGAALREAGLLVLLAGLGWLAFSKGRVWAGPLGAGAVALQIGIGNFGIAPTAAPNLLDASRPLAEAILADTPVGQRPRMWRDPSPQAVWTAEGVMPLAETLAMNVGITHGLGYVRSYTAFSTAASAHLWRAIEAKKQQKPVLDLLSVTHILVPPRAPVPPGIGLVPRVESASTGFRLYRNTAAFPSSRPVQWSVTAANTEQAVEAVLTDEVLRGTAVVIEGRGADTSPLVAASASPLGTCSTSRPSGNAMRVECELTAAAWIVVNETFHHNWKATLDGAPVELHRANAIVMAARAPAGHRLLRLEYGEPRLIPGLLGAAGAVAVSLGLLLFGRRKASSVCQT